MTHIFREYQKKWEGLFSLHYDYWLIKIFFVMSISSIYFLIQFSFKNGFQNFMELSQLSQPHCVHGNEYIRIKLWYPLLGISY